MEGAVQPPTPDRFGQYRILRTLGEGGMGTVYLAQHAGGAQPDTEVALKVLRPGHHTENLVPRFETEQEALAMMDHPNIAKLFSIGTCADSPYFAMEFIPGLSLDEFMVQETPSLATTLTVFTQICAGVEHAHQRSVIHRDLKPANVIVGEVDAVPIPKLIDFGLARALDKSGSRQTAQGLALGTLAYMSPEQAAGHIDRVKAAADTYSLGVILYEMLCGALPFDAEELRRAGLLKAVTRIHTEVPPAPSKRLAQRRHAPALGTPNRGLDRIVMRALAKDPADRYPSVASMATEVERELRNLGSNRVTRLLRRAFGRLRGR